MLYFIKLKVNKILYNFFNKLYLQFYNLFDIINDFHFTDATT